MKVSFKATYGILAALDLAMHNGISPVQAKAIARRHAMPLRFLEQVLHAMKKAGLVESLRGARRPELRHPEGIGGAPSTTRTRADLDVPHLRCAIRRT